jgi:hypothetical protein
VSAVQVRRRARLLLRVLFGVPLAVALVVTVTATATASTVAERPTAAKVRILDWRFDGTTFTLSGTAVAETILRILVQVKPDTGWTKVARSEVGLDRAWRATFRDPTRLGGEVDGRFKIRVEMVATGRLLSGLEGTMKWKGVPDPTAAPAHYNPDAPLTGDAASHAFVSVDAAGTPAHWDPCTPITYFVNTATLPEGAGVTVAEAFTRVAAITGATFVDGGQTALIAGAGGALLPAPDRGEGIYVAFADPTIVPDLTGTVLGLGGHYFSSWPSADMRIIVGTIVIDTSDPLAPGFTSGLSIGGVLEHELGHVLGLAHIDDPTQLMYPHARPTGPSTFQAGDRAGLVDLQAGGCPVPVVS